MTLRAHMQEQHPNAPLRRSNEDLADEHALQHHQYSGDQDHYHEGPNRGPGERPPGWRTGEGARAKSQGYSVVRIPPFWEVVERPRENASGVEHIVVDTMPTMHGRLPVKVHGPASRKACVEWARHTARLYLTVKGSLIGDELIGGE